MIFLDTCIWIELVAAKNPTTPKDIRQATLASELIASINQQNEKIITCKEQLLEIISAIQKYKMREYNRSCKDSSISGVGNLKEFRETDAFNQVQELCRQAYEDVNHIAKQINLTINIEKILDNLHLIDINDCIYYDYCNDNRIDFYTFDVDFQKMPSNSKIHILADQS